MHEASDGHGNKLNMSAQQLFQTSLHLASQNILNQSLIESLCKLHFIFERPCPPQLMTLLQRSLQRYAPTPAVLQWLNVFIFNTCLNNQESAALTDAPMESTEDVSYGHQGVNKGKQGSGNVIRGNLASCLQCLLALPYVEGIVGQANNEAVGACKELRQLLETVDYLTLKYQLKHKHKQKVVQLVQQTNHNSSVLPQHTAPALQLLFSRPQELSLTLNERYSLEIDEVAEVVAANYFNLDPPRAIFANADHSGQAVAEMLAQGIVERVSKRDIFSDTMQRNSRPFQLLTSLLFQRSASLWVRVHSLINGLIDSGRSVMDTVNHPRLQQLATMIGYSLPNQYPHLQHILKHLHATLIAKHSQEEAMELMKKMVLNRMLLNPVRYTELCSPEQGELEAFITVANELRVLFYPKKLPSNSSTRVKELAAMLINSLSRVVRGAESSHRDIDILDRGIYLNDHIVNRVLGNISSQMAQSTPRRPTQPAQYSASSRKSNPIKVEPPSRIELNQHSESSLSFSLRNDSHSRVTPTPSQLPQPQPVKVPPQLPRPSSHTRELPSSNDQVLSELVQLRREYGQLRRGIESRADERRKRRKAWSVQMQAVCLGLEEKRAAVETGVNEVIIDSMML